MGIRVNKCLGYGIDNLKYRKCQIRDPRINHKKFRELAEKASELSFVDEVKWFEEHIFDINNFYINVSQSRAIARDKVKGKIEISLELVKMRLKDFNKKDHSKVTRFNDVIYEGEFGNPRVLLVVPWACERNDYCRHDNHLDYYEETLTHNQESHHRFLGCPMYPWDMWIVDTDQPWPEKIKRLFMDRKVYHTMTHNEFHIVQYFKNEPDIELFCKSLRPYIPVDICITLWWWREIFADPVEFAKSMKPMLYTYWA